MWIMFRLHPKKGTADLEKSWLLHIGHLPFKKDIRHIGAMRETKRQKTRQNPADSLL